MCRVRGAGESKCWWVAELWAVQGCRMLLGNAGFSLVLLLPACSGPGTIMKTEDLNGRVLEVPHFILFPIQKKYLQGSRTVESPILPDRSQLESFCLFNSEEWQPRGSLTPCAATTAASPEGKTQKSQLKLLKHTRASYFIIFKATFYLF